LVPLRCDESIYGVVRCGSGCNISCEGQADYHYFGAVLRNDETFWLSREISSQISSHTRFLYMHAVNACFALYFAWAASELPVLSQGAT
jgi:hypothetical protein